MVEAQIRNGRPTERSPVMVIDGEMNGLRGIILRDEMDKERPFVLKNWDGSEMYPEVSGLRWTFSLTRTRTLSEYRVR